MKSLRSLLLNWLIFATGLYVKLGFIYTAIHSVKLLRGTSTQIVMGSEILDGFSMKEHLFSPHPAVAAPDDDSL